MTKRTKKPTPNRKRPAGLLVRLTYAELADLHEYAERLGVPAATYARVVLLDAARRNAALPAPADD